MENLADWSALVKTVKRMVLDCIGRFGKLDGPRFSRALLTLRNTPDRDTRVSPAMCLFGRPMRDFLPSQKGQMIGEMWQQLASQREQALARRGSEIHTRLLRNVRRLKPLQIGDHVMVQNQSGNHPLRWDRRGVVVSTEGYDQYKVRIDGSRNVTRRNRKFLRVFQPFRPSDQLPIVPGGGDDSIPRNVDYSRPGVLLDHSEKEVVFPTPTGLSDDAGDRSESQDIVQGGDVSDSMDLPTQSPAVEQGRGTVSTRDGVVDNAPVTPTSDVRRSVRAGRGTTSRYDDFVRD